MSDDMFSLFDNSGTIEVELTDEQNESLAKVLELDEIKVINERFRNGTPTENDLLNCVQHFQLTLDNGIELDLVEYKFYQQLVELYKKRAKKSENGS
jgi:hypothetical protein